jgi:hypothetical protein
MTPFNLTCPGLVAQSVMIWEHWKFERGVWRTFVGLKLETESNVPNDVFREASQVALIVGPGNRSRKMLAQE